jgi:hypothetical protein
MLLRKKRRKKKRNKSWPFSKILGEIVNGAGSVCDQKTSKFFVLHGRVHGRTHGCKGSLLKVREGKYMGA